MITTQDILDVIKIHPLKVKNIYQYGSRVYGTESEYSDHDFIVIASNLLEKQEIKHNDLNIHIHTADVFIRDLKNLEMHCLECIYATGSSKLQEKLILPDKNFSPTIDEYKYKGMNQSYNSFQKAKERMNEGDLYRAVKGVFHSLRILMFFKQIIDHGKIVDFTCANKFWWMIKEDFDAYKHDWTYYKEKYLPIKIELENKFKN